MSSAQLDADALLSGHDATQVQLMEEKCILVNRSDQVIGLESKKNCHLNVNIEKGMLHRAFSIFLFDQQNRLLLQQRASEKITFPDFWTNTCCSHPIYFEQPGEVSGMGAADYQPEMETKENMGIKRAAVRKLDHELGIKLQESDFTFITKILYKAPSSGIWGEHEIDYILFAKKPEITAVPNLNEVRDFRYFTIEEVKALVDSASDEAGAVKITPWFGLIVKHFLFKWWNDVDSLDQHLDLNSIHEIK